MKLFKLFMISIVLMAFFYTNVSAQKDTPDLPIDSASGKITYTDVVYVDDNANKSELYSRAREWFAKTYNSSNNVIQMEDKESGKIVGKALLQVYNKAWGMKGEAGYINYTISIYMKDSRYKYEITNFHHTGQYSNGTTIPDYGVCENMINTTDKQLGVSYQKQYNGYLNTMNDNINALIADLKNAMSINTTSITNDDW